MNDDDKHNVSTAVAGVAQLSLTANDDDTNNVPTVVAGVAQFGITKNDDTKSDGERTNVTMTTTTARTAAIPIVAIDDTCGNHTRTTNIVAPVITCGDKQKAVVSRAKRPKHGAWGGVSQWGRPRPAPETAVPLRARAIEPELAGMEGPDNPELTEEAALMAWVNQKREWVSVWGGEKPRGWGEEKPH